MVKNIPKYLKSARDYVLNYFGDQLCECKFSVRPEDCASTSSFVFMLAGGAVSWHSVKQKATTDSTTEAKYVAASRQFGIGDFFYPAWGF